VTETLRVFGFLGFVAFGLLAAWLERTAPGRSARTALNAFLLYTLAVSFGVGFRQFEMWPFSTWPLVAGIHGPVADNGRIVAVDRAGVEHDVDYRAWQPFVVEELQAWADSRLMRLAPADRATAAAFMVELAERGRQAARAGQAVGYFDRLWGPFTAPYFLLHPKRWTSPETAPREPLVGVRVYRESWNLDARRSSPSAVRRSLVFEYLRP
jgi:hypothetical protein